MSVNSYLSDLASELVLSTTEKESINKSVATLRSRLTAYFSDDIKEQFQFGSSMRGTILPRKADSESDIDYMVVFDTSRTTLKPQSYLTKLKTFAESKYSTSEIYQSHPTLVLELNHIKFELVPAINSFWTGYQIPSPSSSWAEWMTTNPNGYNNTLTSVNTNNNYLIKPVIRLSKYWNALSHHCYYSFKLEEYICGLSYYGCTSLWDYFRNFGNGLTYLYTDSQALKDKVDRLKKLITSTRNLELQGNYTLAETEIKKLLHEL